MMTGENRSSLKQSYIVLPLLSVAEGSDAAKSVLCVSVSSVSYSVAGCMHVVCWLVAGPLQCYWISGCNLQNLSSYDGLFCAG